MIFSPVAKVDLSIIYAVAVVDVCRFASLCFFGADMEPCEDSAWFTGW